MSRPIGAQGNRPLLGTDNKKAKTFLIHESLIFLIPGIVRSQIKLPQKFPCYKAPVVTTATKALFRLFLFLVTRRSPALEIKTESYNKAAFVFFEQPLLDRNFFSLAY